MQSRESGHEMQGRDRSAHHVFRSSMSDHVNYTRSSMTDPSYPGPQRGMVTPQVRTANIESAFSLRTMTLTPRVITKHRVADNEGCALHGTHKHHVSTLNHQQW